MKYTVRRVNILPLAKFGFILGGLALVLPGVMCGVMTTQLIAALRVLLDKLATSQADLGMVGQVPFDFINILGLEATQQLVVTLDNQAMSVALLVVLVSVIGGGALIGGTIWLLGLAYNLVAAVTGGIEVELQSK